MFHEFGFGRAAELGLALRAAAAVERYQRLMCELVARGSGAELHRRATNEIEAIRKDCVSLPGLSVAVVELSISHAELVFALLKADVLGELGQQCLRGAVERNQEISEGLCRQLAHIGSTRKG
jgi:hypothetical protein